MNIEKINEQYCTLSSMGNTKRMLPPTPIVDVAVMADTMKLIPIIHFREVPLPSFLLITIISITETNSRNKDMTTKTELALSSGTEK